MYFILRNYVNHGDYEVPFSFSIILIILFCLIPFCGIYGTYFKNLFTLNIV